MRDVPHTKQLTTGQYLFTSSHRGQGHLNAKYPSGKISSDYSQTEIENVCDNKTYRRVD